MKIDNFKCFNSETSIDFSKLTILSGLNSSGKSSVYQAFLGLKQSELEWHLLEEGIRLPIFTTYGELLKLGTVEDVFNDLNRPFSFEFELDKKYYNYCFEIVDKNVILTKFRFEDRAADEESYYQVFCDIKNKELLIEAKSILRFTSYETENALNKYLVENEIIEKEEKKFLSEFVTFQKVKSLNFRNHQLLNFHIPIEELINCINPLIRNKIDKKHFRDNIEKAFEDEKNVKNVGLYAHGSRLFQSVIDIEFITPNREIPRRYYETSLQDDDEMGHILSVASNASKQIDYRHNDGEIKKGTLLEAIIYWSNYILGIDGVEQEDSIEGIMTSLLITQDGQKHPINLVGFGISQSLPIIMKVLGTKYDFCIIDEPEIHLHPQAQIRFAEFFKEMAMLGKQIIVETHSEYIINYLIHESLITNDKDLVSMYWVKKEGPSSFIDKINWDKYGFIDNKPEGFSDGMDEIVSKFIDYRMKIDSNTWQS